MFRLYRLEKVTPVTIARKMGIGMISEEKDLLTADRALGEVKMRFDKKNKT